MTDAQGVLHAVFTEASRTIGLTVVASVSAATPFTASDRDLNFILNDVFDSATGTLRIVEVT